MEKKYILLLFTVFISFFSTGQNITVNTTTDMPASIVACGDFATFGFNAISFANGAEINVALPNGVKFNSIVSGPATGVVTATGAKITLTAATSVSGSIIRYSVQTACTPTVVAGSKVTYKSGTIPDRIIDFPGVVYPISEVSNVSAVGSTMINVGQSAVYNVSVTQGIGYTKTINLNVTHSNRLTLSFSNPAVGTITVGTPGNNGMQTDVIKINPSQINAIGNNNGHFETNEIYTFGLKATLNSCSPNGEVLSFKAFYGCNAVCETGNVTTAGLTQNGAGNPSLTMTQTQAAYPGIMGQSDDAIFVLTNNGTGVARGVSIRLGFSSGASNYAPAKVPSMDFYDVKVNGIPAIENTVSDTFSFNFTSDPDGAGTGFEDLDGDGFYNDLAPGSSVTITAKLVQKAIDYYSDCGSNNSIGISYEILRWRLMFSNACNQTSTYDEPNNNLGANRPFSVHYLPTSDILSSPLEIFNYGVGDKFKLIYSFGNGNYMTLYKNRMVDGANAFFRLKVLLPTGVLPDPNVLPSASESSLWHVTYNAAISNPSTGIFYYDIKSTNNLLNPVSTKFYLPVYVDPSCNQTGTFLADFSVHLHQSDTEFLPIAIACTKSPNFTLTCGNPNGLTIDSFNMKRQSFGTTDQTGTVPVTENTSGILLNSYLNGDKAIAAYKLRIVDPTISSAKIVLDYNKDIWLKDGINNGGIKEITGIYTDPDTNLTTPFSISGSNLSSYYTYTDDYVINGIHKSGYTFDILKLFNNGNVLSGVTKKANAKLDFDVAFRLNGGDYPGLANGGIVQIKELKTYSLVKLNSNSSEIVADERADAANVNYVSVLASGAQSYNARQCTSLNLGIGLSFSVASTLGNIFPNEFRLSSNVPKFEILVPIGVIPTGNYKQYHFSSSLSASIDPPVINYGFNFDGTPNPNGLYNKFTFINNGNWVRNSLTVDHDILNVTFDYTTSNNIRKYTETNQNFILKFLPSQINYSINQEFPRQIPIQGILRTIPITLNLLDYSISANPTTLTTNTNIASWNITINNSSSSSETLPNTWLAIEGPTDIDFGNVTFWYGATQLPTINYGNNKYWAHVGNVPASGKIIEVRSSKYGVCGEGQFKVKVGFDCLAYPVSPLQEFVDPTSPAPYSKEIVLTLKTQSPILGATSEINNTNTEKFDVCTEITETLIVSNSANGYAYIISPQITLPVGLKLLPGTFRVIYNNVAYNLSASDVVPLDTTGSSYRINLQNINAPFVINGLPGATELNNSLRSFRLEYKLITGCSANTAESFVSGGRIIYRINGQSGCGEQLLLESGQTIIRSNPIDLNGAPLNKEYVNSIVSNEVPNNQASLHINEEKELTVTVRNINGTVGLELETIKVSVHNAYDYVAGSFILDSSSVPSYISDIPVIAVDNSGKRTISWKMNSGFTVGDEIKFKFKVKVVDPTEILCLDKQFISLNTYVGAQVTCVSTNSTCTLEFPTGIEKEVELIAHKPAISAIMTSSVLNANNTFANFNLSFDVTNEDPVYEVKPGLSLKIFRDINGNGIIDTGDVLVPGNFIIPTAISPGATYAGNLTGTYTGSLVTLLLRAESTHTDPKSDICEPVVISSFPCAPGLTEPIFVAPLPEIDITIEPQNVPAPAIVNAVDNYGSNLPVAYSQIRTDGTCPGKYTLIRVWTATDDCGTSKIFTQTIHVIDTTKPVAVIPPSLQNIVVNCDNPNALTDAMAIEPSVTDNVSTEEYLKANRVPISDVITLGCGNTRTILRSFQYTDECGNLSNIVTQNIQVIDIKAPLIDTAPNLLNRNLECSDTVGLAEALELVPTATDNCTSASVLVPNLISDVTAPSITCSKGYIRTRVWNFNDGCGNISANYIQTITVADTTAPIISTVANALNRTVECSDAVGLNDALGLIPVATDNCSTNLIITLLTDISTPSLNCGKGYIRSRTWNFRDECGNLSLNYTQTITVVDTTPPVITTLPNALNRTVQCSDIQGLNAALTLLPVASDNCSTRSNLIINLVSDVTTPSLTCGKGYIQVRTWNFEDECGNVSSNFVQTITVQDTQAPTITTPINSLNRTLECSDTIGIESALDLFPAATDNCSLGAAITMNLVSDVTTATCVNGFTQVRTWNFTDECGNTSANFVQTIRVRDTQAPVISTVANSLNRTLECSDTVGLTAALALAPTATDNCSVGTEITMNLVSDVTTATCANGFTQVRTWNFTDACGNTSANFVQIIVIQDTQAPVVSTATFALDRTLECSDTAGLTAALTLAPVATDNCSTGTGILMHLVSDHTIPSLSCANRYTQVRIWNFEDECGNVSTNYIQTITVVDTIAPVISTVANALNRTVECSDAAGLASALALVPTATDACTTNPLITLVSDISTPSITCGKGYERLRTWNFRDACGNTSVNYVQTITVVDTTPPVISTLAGSLDRILECSNAAGLTAALALSPKATDNCSTRVNLTISLVTDITTPTCGKGYIQVRTWNFEDECGNVSTNFVQTITVQDTQAPTITTPINSLNRTLECSDTIGIESALDLFPAATDNCSLGAAIAMNLVSDVTTATCANGFTQVRTWNFTDECGNTSANFVQTIRVRDTQAPVISTVANSLNRTLECSDTVGLTAALALAPTATDNCSVGTEITMNLVSDVTTATCANGFTQVRTWNFTDACGNTSANFVQILTIVDKTAPVIVTVVNNLNRTVECSDIQGLNDALALEPTATDNCSAAIAIHLVSDDTVPSLTCENAYMRIRTWNFEDECGNVSAKFVQTITVIDITSPIFVGTLPSNITVSCDAIPVMEVLNATDNCGSVTVTSSEIKTNGTCTNSYTLLRTWIADDGCGNRITHNQLITVEDSTPPTFVGTLPSDLVLECTDEVPTMQVLTATDNCGIATVSSIETRTNGSCANSFVIVRKWIATDACGLTTSHTQTITVEDSTPPTFVGTLPTDLVLECHDEVPQIAVLAATDNCGLATVSSIETRTNGSCPNNYVIVRTWTATDTCGLTADYSQTITVVDMSPPTFIEPLPADLVLECSEVVPDMAVLTATDNCGYATVSSSEIISYGTCANTYTIVRSWAATDECGNTAVHFQTITVQDSTAPEFVQMLPLDVTVSCDAVPEMAILTATDNCGFAKVTSVETKNLGSCPNSYELVRTWTATDECGNVKVHTQIVNVEDTTAPKFVGNLPENEIFIKCEDLKPAEKLMAIDNCGEVIITTSDQTIPGDCDTKYIILRTWIATDSCNNQTTFEQTIHLSCPIEVYNGVSANGDGINDELVFNGIECYPGNSVQILNRWGTVVYETRNYNSNGNTFKGYSQKGATINSSSLLPSGTYYYILKYDYDLGNGDVYPREQAGFFQLESN